MVERVKDQNAQPKMRCLYHIPFSQYLGIIVKEGTETL